MATIYLFLMTDYLLTYIGIRLNLIEEANTLMVWMFEMPLMKGLIIRLVISGVVILPFYYLKTHCRYYKKVIAAVIILYVGVMVLHIRWIAII